MPLRPDLFAAYRAADYTVFTDPCLVLKVGEPNPLLDQLLEAEGARSAAFVTAANPRGAASSASDNARAYDALRQHVSARGWPAYAGEGRDPQGAWTAEPSFLVLGISRDEAEALGRTFEQNAIVFVERGQAPRLAILK